MAYPTEDTTIVVDAPGLEAMGYCPDAVIEIQPSMGRYVVTLIRLTDAGTESREVAWEPAEPERQRLGIKIALSNPEWVVLDAARIDRDRRAEGHPPL